MKKVLLVAAVAAAAALAPVAAPGGGFATVGLASLPQEGLEPGAAWTADLTVRQHGRTPLDGVQPVVRVRSADGAVVREFPARPSGRPGGYRAVVRFPTGGRWSYEIWDGFSQTHTYPPIEVGAPAPAARFPAAPVAAAAAATLALAALAVLLLRRSRGGPRAAVARP